VNRRPPGAQGPVDGVAIAARLADVRAQIEQATHRAGRPSCSVRLIAVAKGHPAGSIEAAYRAGHREFGENYAQELVDKRETLASLEGLRWRFIGHLQRNKVRGIVDSSATVDTVDSLRLGEALAARSCERGIVTEVLLQVNVGDETQKSGCHPDEVPALVHRLRSLEGLDVVGLMMVPPALEDPVAARPYFARLRTLAEHAGLAELSMGMSHDLEVAIEEGATMVRVGTAMFGPRPPRR
jgi:hypothetical protein